jgi:hypothetical protein
VAAEMHVGAIRIAGQHGFGEDDKIVLHLTRELPALQNRADTLNAMAVTRDFRQLMRVQTLPVAGFALMNGSRRRKL